MSATPRTLTAMQNRPTAYEIGLYQDGKLVDTLAFTVRRSKHVLLRVMQQHGERILAMVPGDGEMTFKAGIWTLGNGVTVRPTGRTEREVASIDGRI